MSQPVGIIAKIKISEENYKKFLRKEAVSVLSQEIFESIKNHTNNIFVFTYLKKENILYSFCYFHYGDRDFLLHHPIFILFKNITSYLDLNSTGYLITTLDSLNNTVKDFASCQSIINQQWKDRALTEEEFKNYSKDADKYFYKKANTNMATLLSKIVDKSIVKKVKVLQEQDHIQNLKNNLHTATLEKPIEIFKGYFYNGRQFYCTYREKITIFDRIDLQSLQQTNYGLCDNNGVIIEDYYLKTNPAKFKKWEKSDTLFYASAEAVYDYDYYSKLKPYSNSDGLSFKLINEYVAEDKDHIYFIGKQLLKTDIGVYKINTSGYYFPNIILYSTTKVYAGTVLLQDIDAESFEIVSPDATIFCKTHQLDAFNRPFIMHCRDKNGEFIIYNYNPGKTLPAVERINSLADYVANTKSLLQNLEKTEQENQYPKLDNKNAKDYYASLNKWLAENFDENFEKLRYNRSFLIDMNEYFHFCFQLYSETKNKEYLLTGAAMFEKIAATCFINPFIFHNTACIYAALNDEEKALQSASAAYYYGYKEIEQIWKDTDLQLLFKNKHFRELSANYEANRNQYPIINSYIIDKVNAITIESSKKEISLRVLKSFIIPDYNWFQTAANYDKTHYEALAIKVKDFLNNALQLQVSDDFKKSYEQYKNYDFLNVQTHLKALCHYFSDAHFKYGTTTIDSCKPIAQKLKTLLAQQQNDYEMQTFLKELKEAEVNKIFTLI